MANKPLQNHGRAIMFIGALMVTKGATFCNNTSSYCRRYPAFISPVSVQTSRRHRSGSEVSPVTGTVPTRRQTSYLPLSLSTQPIDQLADDDLVAIPFDGYIASTMTSSSSKDTTIDIEEESSKKDPMQLRLCVIRAQQNVLPLIRHEDDVETDLFLDPRHIEKEIQLSNVMDWYHLQQQTATTASSEAEVTPSDVPYYGVGWYGQRPVPSLGGGPGYGAEADEVWSIEEEVLETLEEEGVELPVIDVGMAHGEKARGGALF